MTSGFLPFPTPRTVGSVLRTTEEGRAPPGPASARLARNIAVVPLVCPAGGVPVILSPVFSLLMAAAPAATLERIAGASVHRKVPAGTVIPIPQVAGVTLSKL